MKQSKAPAPMPLKNIINDLFIFNFFCLVLVFLFSVLVYFLIFFLLREVCHSAHLKYILPSAESLLCSNQLNEIKEFF